MGITSPVLVLNVSYEPINVCAAKRALTLVVKGLAQVEETHDRKIYRDILLPSVIRLKHYRRIPVRRQVVSGGSVFIRDQYVCQYCGERFPAHRLTLDHVLPRSRGGLDTWENLVAACHACNRRKANRTPAEAGMPLLHLPRALVLHSHRMHSIGTNDPRWGKFLFR